MAITKIKPVKSTLSKALDYIQNSDKTDGKMLVSSFGCAYETADIEFELEMSRNVQSGNTQNLKSSFVNQAACCACAHSLYFTGGSPSGLRV